MILLSWTGGTAIYALLVASRLLLLAPYRAGWLMYLANVVWELLEKRGGINRFRLEGAGAGASLALLGLGGAPVIVVALLTLELANRLWERDLLTRIPARLDPNGLRSKADPARRFPSPSVHPELTPARYPSDPQHIYHAAMLVFWRHRAHRRGMPMVYLGYQHLRQFAIIVFQKNNFTRMPPL